MLCPLRSSERLDCEEFMFCSTKNFVASVERLRKLAEAARPRMLPGQWLILSAINFVLLGASLPRWDPQRPP